MPPHHTVGAKRCDIVVVCVDIPRFSTHRESTPPVETHSEHLTIRHATLRIFQVTQLPPSRAAKNAIFASGKIFSVVSLRIFGRIPNFKDNFVVGDFRN